MAEKSVDLGLLIKLGSIAVHVGELLSPQGHAFDRDALDTVLGSPDVKAFLAELDKQGLLPFPPRRRSICTAETRETSSA